MKDDEPDVDRSGSDDDGSESSFEIPSALATGREKRQTAGNRLREMLNAELESEAIFAEDVEDEDFGSDQDQQDDLDSELDNDSSDDQPPIEIEDAGERQLEKQEKELARARKRKAAEAFRKPRPVNHAASRKVQTEVKDKQVPQKRRTTDLQRPSTIKRQSSRAHAVEIAGAVEKRLHEEADRRAKTAKTAKVEERPMTQAERLEEAKLTEARNVASLNEIVKYEEDKRATQRLMAARRKATGPYIRFVSTSRMPQQALESIAPEKISRIEPVNTTGSDVPSLSHPLDVLGISQTDTPKVPITAPASTESGMTLSTTKHVTQYISVHNSTTTEGIDRADILRAVFGQEPKAQSVVPQPRTCSLSGLIARYKDPVTQIYYGNQQAFATLQDLKNGTMPWNPQLKMYVPRSTLQH